MDRIKIKFTTIIIKLDIFDSFLLKLIAFQQKIKK
jgi:hypothetical protein